MPLSEITVRQMEFNYPGNPEMVFIPDEPESSYFFTGFSIVLHYVEPYMIRTMKAAKSRVSDLSLLADMEQFCRQEAQHYTQHKKFNESLHTLYPGIKPLEAIAKKEYESFSKTKTLKFNMAYAEGFESAATVAALFTLANGPLAKAEGCIGDIWRWHFCEELEHRTVAYDVYKYIYGDYLYKTAVAAWAQTHFVKMGMMFTNYLLEVDKQKILDNHGGKKGRNKRALNTILEQKGMVANILKTYSPFYSPHNLHIPPEINAMTKAFTEQALNVS